MTQDLTGYGCFGRYLHRIGREEASGCHHCANSPEEQHGGPHSPGVPFVGRAPPGPRPGLRRRRPLASGSGSFRPWSGAKGKQNVLLADIGLKRNKVLRFKEGKEVNYV
ncbi:uncharacterized protein LOC124634368 [Helicoverpa zea]|uniref:uncharacterized protein LOC124634368 n=1 Tax=Helicoverpa zea TaxID=7113 RepID=UPI001F57BDD0|nr:uncharacterized protein LOC124634368 [Helicoverpa zea]